MCGINLIYKFDNNLVDKQDLVTMCSSQAHRGPDEAGIAVLNEGKVGLGHVRLSIMDVDHGQQPMFSDDGTLAITYNGEIYELDKLRALLSKHGHQFKTRCDTEVVLKLYQQFGEAFVEHLNGEFAFVIWDTRHNKLLAVRDRCGIKPLFYYYDQNELVMASEAKSILSLPRIKNELDPDYFYSTPFAFQIQGVSPFEGVASVKPGHMLTIHSGKVREHCYWSPEFKTDHTIGFNEAKHKLHHLFEESVSRRMVSDVPVGTYLSGGIDSTLTCAMMAKSAPDLKAFHLSYFNTDYDESPLAKKIADHYGVELHTLDCSLDDLAESLPDAIYHSELLIANPGHVGKMLLSKFAREHGVKVCLTGEGADEFFAGYAFFKQEAIWRLLKDPKTNKKTVESLYQQFQEKEYRSQELNWTKSNAWRKDNELFGYPSFKQTVVEQLSKMVAPNLFSAAFMEKAAMTSPKSLLHERYPEKNFTGMDPLNVSRQVALSTLSEYIIPVLGDRAEMAHSLECRTPFLDRDLIEFAAKLPPEYLLQVSELREKYILHETFKNELPAFMYTQPKHPFSANNWYEMYTKTQKGKALFEHYFDPAVTGQANIFNPEYLKTLYNLWQKLPAHSPMLKKIQATMGVVLNSHIMHEKFVANRCHPEFLVKVKDYSPDIEANKSPAIRVA